MNAMIQKSDYGDIPSIRVKCSSDGENVHVKIGYESNEDIMGDDTMGKAKIKSSLFMKMRDRIVELTQMKKKEPAESQSELNNESIRILYTGKNETYDEFDSRMRSFMRTNDGFYFRDGDFTVSKHEFSNNGDDKSFAYVMTIDRYFPRPYCTCNPYDLEFDNYNPDPYVVAMTPQSFESFLDDVIEMIETRNKRKKIKK